MVGIGQNGYMFAMPDCQKLLIKMYAHDLLPFAFSERLNACQCWDQPL